MVRSSQFRRVMTIRQRALLALRSPPRGGPMKRHPKAAPMSSPSGIALLPGRRRSACPSPCSWSTDGPMVAGARRASGPLFPGPGRGDGLNQEANSGRPEGPLIGARGPPVAASVLPPDRPGHGRALAKAGGGTGAPPRSVTSAVAPALKHPSYGGPCACRSTARGRAQGLESGPALGRPHLTFLPRRAGSSWPRSVRYCP